jgi:2'-5' RNA ligase
MSSTQLAGVASAFALVAYIPGVLGAFIDELSAWLPGESRGKAHLTLLPPRPLTLAAQMTADLLSDAVACLRPFKVELTAIERFRVTDVLYIALGRGADETYRAHAELNRGVFFFDEPFEYRPHVTLMVPKKYTDVGRAHREAKERWVEFRGAREFMVERLDLLRQDSDGEWENLRQIELAENGGPVS